MNKFSVFLFLLVATTLEASGDAIVRMALHNNNTPARAALFICGAALLFGYGLSLNLAPTDFGRVVGLYVATLFVVWQIVNFIAFRATPSLPTIVGGAMIVAGGLIVTFWER